MLGEAHEICVQIICHFLGVERLEECLDDVAQSGYKQEELVDGLGC